MHMSKKFSTALLEVKNIFSACLFQSPFDSHKHWVSPIDQKYLVMFLKVHKREKFFVSDFEFFTILKLVKLKY